MPDNRFETFAYDAVGRLTNRTDYAGNATGYQYDNADRVKQRVFVDGSVFGTTYTTSGQIATLTQTSGSTSTVAKYTYDALDRLTDIQNPDGSKLHYAYDAASQKTNLALTMPDGQTQNTTYTYDVAGNLSSVTTDGKTFAYKYDADNRKTERNDPNGNITKYTYDLNGRLTGWITTQGGAANAPIQQQGSYTLNAAGQRIALAYQAPDGLMRNLAYTYDGAGRLIGETRSLPGHSTTWVLDAVGNRTSQTQDGQTNSYSHDATDRLTGVSGAAPATYTWDTNGQLQSKTVGSGASTKTTTYSFDARHELIGVVLQDGTKIDYRYTADGNLATRAKTSPGQAPQTTHYLIDPNLSFAQVVAEYDDQGHATSSYTYGDELLQRSRSGQSTYYHHDGLGSVIALSDDSGGAIQAYGYDAWGNPVESAGVDTNPYRYTGERYDQDTGLIYLRARWYDPTTGRFVSPDEANGQLRRPISLNRSNWTVLVGGNQCGRGNTRNLNQHREGSDFRIRAEHHLRRR
ncbi:MAG: RHS repeat-associated core domain-containing protein [Gammaproteobacteria bacterium]|nr:MAG: RHS repeat-associated core domain-containing protein [Gammaproteobacteria bacterium]